MTAALDNKQQARLLTAPARRLMDALRPAGEARIVGGAVRDVVLGRPIGDIDFATTLSPETVVELLGAQHIKTVPTGINHGTITAVIDHIGYEITTLRRDIATDGRHARVEFTDDWQADAARRDFTFNALYVDADGKLYDYFNGVEDAQQGQVRFIGDPSARIREDILRILRFFRFYAWFGAGEADAAALTACRALANLISTLSAERMAREILKLLAAPNPLPAWRLMAESGALTLIAAEAANIDRLQSLIEREKAQSEQTAPLTRLAALLPDENAASAIASRLKFSKRDEETLRLLAFMPSLIDDPRAFYNAGTPHVTRGLIYSYGVKTMRAAFFLNGNDLAANLALIDAWENPVFPIRGEDLIKRGMPPGPRVGDILRDVENWWIAGDFRAGRDACLAQADELSKS